MPKLCTASTRESSKYCLVDSPRAPLLTADRSATFDVDQTHLSPSRHTQLISAPDHADRQRPYVGWELHPEATDVEDGV